MATYKVLQDIEAEDKLLGPLSLRQFIYAIIVFVCGFVGFRLLTFRWYLALPFIPPMIFFGLLAAPFGRDQPSEVWLLAKIRFFLKPRKRIWDQTGIKELVTITVPKTIERVVSKGFSDQEVNSRLKALAATLDSRGWAVKNIDVTTFRQPLVTSPANSDRLFDISNIPSDGAVAVDPESDILDEQHNPVAQKVDMSLEASTQAHRQELLAKVRSAAEQQKQEEIVKQSRGKLPETGDLSPQDKAMLELIRQQSGEGLPPVNKPASPIPQKQSKTEPQTAVTPKSDPGILKLVKNNDLNVATLRREAKRQKGEDPEDEVVISLR